MAKNQYWLNLLWSPATITILASEDHHRAHYSRIQTVTELEDLHVQRAFPPLGPLIMTLPVNPNNRP
jgi:hypothetical protein